MDGGAAPAPPDLAATAARMAAAARVLFVDHSSRIAGAELVLLDVVRDSAAGSAVFVFEDGLLLPALREAGIAPILSRHAGDLSRIRRASGLLQALPKSRQLLATVQEIARAARDRDIVYANSQKAFALSAFAGMLSRRPVLWHLHDILDAAHFGRAQRRLCTTLANRFAAAVIVPSDAAARAFVASGGRRQLVRIVPNGLDLAAPDGTAEATRAAVGLPPGFLFGVFSRLARWKGQHVALAALALLPDARCAIVGDAQFGEHDYAAELRRLADQLGVADRVHFLGHRNDVAALMHAVDAVVHPSIDPEPFGRTLVEAMRLRRPVIATASGAAPEILDGDRCGRLVAPGDAAALAAALREVRAGGPALDAMVAAAAMRAEACYGAGRMRAAIAAIVDELAAVARA